MGGFAWQNTELVPNLWLWYGFLRSGRKDYFYWAEAMTRHCAECDLYHSGPYRGLGSRHSVVHWGDSCKECRMTLTQMYKVFYYLTGDERTGHIMEEMKDPDIAIISADIQRFLCDGKYPCHPRFGPDLMVFIDNWFTHWERTEDMRYRDKIVNVLSRFKALDGFCYTTSWGYDPQTGDMECMEKSAPTHFNYCFGSEYVWPEVLNALEDETLWRAYLNSGLIFSAKGAPDGVCDKHDGAGMSPRMRLERQAIKRLQGSVGRTCCATRPTNSMTR